MALKIYWTDFSKGELRLIFNYYKEKASLKIARKLVLELTHEVIKLQNQPYTGQKEGLLMDKVQEFRYLLHRNYKIIYWVNTQKNRIEIADVFDTRQNPVKIDRNK